MPLAPGPPTVEGMKNDGFQMNLGLTIALGLSFGAAIGVLIDNIAMGAALGMAIGVVVGVLGDQSRKRKHEDPDSPPPGV